MEYHHTHLPNCISCRSARPSRSTPFKLCCSVVGCRCGTKLCYVRGFERVTAAHGICARGLRPMGPSIFDLLLKINFFDDIDT
jgi:hypothetical protein